MSNIDYFLNNPQFRLFPPKEPVQQEEHKRIQDALVCLSEKIEALEAALPERTDQQKVLPPVVHGTVIAAKTVYDPPVEQVSGIILGEEEPEEDDTAPT